MQNQMSCVAGCEPPNSDLIKSVSIIEVLSDFIAVRSKLKIEKRSNLVTKYRIIYSKN